MITPFVRERDYFPFFFLPLFAADPLCSGSRHSSNFPRSTNRRVRPPSPRVHTLSSTCGKSQSSPFSSLPSYRRGGARCTFFFSGTEEEPSKQTASPIEVLPVHSFLFSDPLAWTEEIRFPPESAPPQLYSFPVLFLFSSDRYPAKLVFFSPLFFFFFSRRSIDTSLSLRPLNGNMGRPFKSSTSVRALVE